MVLLERFVLAPNYCSYFSNLSWTCLQVSTLTDDAYFLKFYICYNSSNCILSSYSSLWVCSSMSVSLSSESSYSQNYSLVTSTVDSYLNIFSLYFAIILSIFQWSSPANVYKSLSIRLFISRNLSLNGGITCLPLLIPNSQQSIFQLFYLYPSQNYWFFSYRMLISWWSTASHPWFIKSAIGISADCPKQYPKHLVITALQQKLKHYLICSNGYFANCFVVFRYSDSQSRSLSHQMRTCRIYYMADLLSPFSILSGQSIAVYGSPIVYKQIFHGLLSILSLWYMRNTHNTLNSQSSDSSQSNRSSFFVKILFSYGSLQHFVTVRIRELGTAITTVFGGISALVPTPWQPLINEGIYTWGWMIQPFSVIHLRSYCILDYFCEVY